VVNSAVWSCPWVGGGPDADVGVRLTGESVCEREVPVNP
jgi:hypothetical protein